MNGDFEFVAPYFDGVSAQAKDLICHMLVVDPAKRMSAEEVLLHPWFSDLRHEDEEEPAPVLKVGINLKEARRLTARSKFRAGVGAVLAVTKTQRLLKLGKGMAT